MDIKTSNSTNSEKGYLRKDIDGGILQDKYEIDRYKLEQYVDVIDNLMLGNYNEFGEYIIQDDIKAELLACKKVIDDNYENILFVKSLESADIFSHLEFAVKVVDSTNSGYKMAVLELLEPIYKGKGFIENTQATFISKIEVLNNDLLKTEIYKAFNIVVYNSDEGAKKEEGNSELFKSVINRKLKLLYLKEKLDMNKEYEIGYKKAVATLKTMPEAKRILQDYKKDLEVAEKYLNVSKDDYKAKSELLENSAQYQKDIKAIVSNIIKDVALKVKNQVSAITKSIGKTRSGERIFDETKKQRPSVVKSQIDVVVSSTIKNEELTM